jgi:RNA polymerase sigma factor (sigma-70 family)
MTTSKLREVIQHLRRAVLLREGADLTDGQLLECFVSCQEAAALEALVRRHGPMVWGVCQRTLRNHHDAEDAFQATFLVLVRKAASIYPRAKVGNWLYGVAHQTALKARATRAKRRVRERPVTQMPEPAVTEKDLWSDLQPLLDQEVSRLPENYRTVIVLCELEGKTGREAARQLGIPEGTVASRLARARTMLAKRLARHGLAVSGGMLAAVLSQKAASACVPTSVLSSTIKAVTLVAAGQAAAAGLVSAKVAVLTEGVVKAMFLSKLKLTATLLLVVGVIATGTAGLHLQFLAGEEPKGPATKVESRAVPIATAKETKPDEGPDDAKSLQGEWQIVDVEKNGKGIAEDPTGSGIIFRGDEITINWGNEVKSKYKLDTGTSPRELHIIFLDRKSNAQHLRAIYSLEKGELKVCMPLGPKSARPTEFKTKAGDGLALLVLRRAQKDAAGDKKPDDVANIKREWLRPDAPPDGNYKLSYVERVSEFTCCLIKLETKDGKQSASLVDTDEDWQVKTARAVVSATPLSSPANPVGQALPKGVPIRVVCTTPRGDLVFEGNFSPGSLEARGHLEVFPEGEVLPATLSATDVTKLKFTSRELSATPLQKALRLGANVNGLRQRAEWTKDAEEKASLVKEAASADKEALAEAPKLFQEGFEKYADHPLVFGAAVDAARFATKYHILAEQLRSMIAKADKTAASYGRRWQQEFSLQIAAALAPQKDYAALALDIATRLEKELVPTETAAMRGRVLKALAAAEANAGNPSAAKETLALRLAKVEETLDREYRAKVPPFKAEAFTGRRAKSDRAVVLELFTGTQCPPCVAAGVAFDALHQTYQPAELVLLQYHLHIPGPDPLTNADSEARWAYYGKSFSGEARGVPTTLFNGKPEAGGGGAMGKAEEKYKQYRQVIDPLLETNSGAKLSASAVKQDNKINIKVEVTDLKNPGGDVRLRLLLVEETIRYVGGNRVRFHHNVVRSMIGGVDGFALNDKDSKHTAAVDLDVLRKSLNGYLDDYNSNWRPFPNADRPLDFANLRLIALVQDDATREILQAALVEIIAGKTAAK